MGSFRALAVSLVTGLSLMLPMAGQTGVAWGHETDPYTAPLGRQQADLGLHLTQWTYDRLVSSVEEANRRLAAAEASGAGSAARQWRSDEGIAQIVAGRFPYAYHVIEGMETYIRSQAFRDRYPGQIAGHKELVDHCYRHAHPIWDPRQVFKFWFATTIKVFDVYVGTDKLGHFTDMGYHYYREYRAARSRGLGAEEAMRVAKDVGLTHPVFSENGVCGLISSGTYSHGDLMSNYAGLQFYRNLTEPMRLKGQMRPAMLVLDGSPGRWRLADHVKRNSDFLSWFFSDHWDEALNPNFYDPVMRPGVERGMRERADEILARYVDERGCRRSPAWFERKAQELATYWGEDYGYARGERAEKVITISKALFTKVDERKKRSGPGNAAYNPAGYTALQMAAMAGDVAETERLLRSGAKVNERSRGAAVMLPDGGVTALHLAVREGQMAVARLLLERGADVNAASETGVRPLFFAGGSEAMTQMLIAAGAQVNAKDRGGRTALHWMAMRDEPGVRTVLRAGGEAGSRDARGRTALHVAAEAGAMAAAAALIEHGAAAGGADRMGVTAMHLAAGAGKTQMVRLLLERGANAAAVDITGRSPLHRAARAGHAQVIALLLAHGGKAGGADCLGTTPLHLAGRAGHVACVAMLLEHGADAMAVNQRGLRPVDEARLSGEAESMRLMMHGAGGVKAYIPLTDGGE
jgi:ankyrin repeat protein